MATILETGYTWQERLFGVFDPTDHRMVEVFGPDGYTDYNGDVLPITREYTVTGTRYSRFGDLMNTIEYIDYCNGSDLIIGRDGGMYLNPQFYTAEDQERDELMLESDTRSVYHLGKEA